MFTQATFHLSGPICQCPEQKLGWSILAETRLEIFCNTCKITLTIPKNKFLAGFKLDTPYPGKVKEAVKPFEVLKGGKVIEFPTEEK